MSVAFSPDGGQIASTVGDKETELVYIWCVATGGLLRRLDGHSNWVTSIAFSSDGRRMIVGLHNSDLQLLALGWTWLGLRMRSRPRGWLGIRWIG
jgi:WD40 repeat protein